jgi:hypothetical protein
MRYWRGSPIDAVKECYPEYDWKEWLFMLVAHGFWDSRANCRKYLDWLAKRLGYQRLDDWYGITYEDFTRTGGQRLVMKYQSSPALFSPNGLVSKRKLDFRADLRPG